MSLKKAETLEEAVKFGTQTLGIKKYKGFTENDLDVINRLNEGLSRVNNASKGRAFMPKKVLFGNVKRKGDFAEIKESGLLIFNKNEINRIKNIYLDAAKTNPKLPVTFTEIMRYEENYRKNNTDAVLNMHFTAFSPISHEMGHLQHQDSLGVIYNALTLLSIKGVKIPGFGDEAVRLKQIFDNSTDTAAKVSPYAASSPLEFIAECYSKMIDGIELDDDVKELHKKPGGAEP